MAEDKEIKVADKDNTKPEKTGKAAKDVKSDKKNESKKPKFAFLKKVLQFLRDMKSELKHVSWYSRKQTINSTILVLICIVIASAVISVLDYGFSSLIFELGKLI